jgi:hypothetical protein
VSFSWERPRLFLNFFSCLPNKTNALGTLKGSYGIPSKYTAKLVDHQTGGIIGFQCMAPNIPDIRYVACFTHEDGLYSCGHDHPTVRDAMGCLMPDGGGFIRAHDAGVFRSLDNRELIDFLESLGEMPWSSRNKAQGGVSAIPAAVDAYEGAAEGRGGS